MNNGYATNDIMALGKGDWAELIPRCEDSHSMLIVILVTFRYSDRAFIDYAYKYLSCQYGVHSISDII